MELGGEETSGSTQGVSAPAGIRIPQGILQNNGAADVDGRGNRPAGPRTDRPRKAGAKFARWHKKKKLSGAISEKSSG